MNRYVDMAETCLNEAGLDKQNTSAVSSIIFSLVYCTNICNGTFALAENCQ